MIGTQAARMQHDTDLPSLVDAVCQYIMASMPAPQASRPLSPRRNRHERMMVRGTCGHDPTARTIEYRAAVAPLLDEHSCVLVT
jgi:hypothetical protein